MNKKLLIGLGIGCAVLCLGATVIGLVAGGLLIHRMTREPENVRISVDAPVMVTKGDSVTLGVQVQNTAAEPQLLDSIDITAEYLAGFAVTGADPAFVDSYPFGDWHSYTFGEAIAPGATLVVEFHSVAVTTGDFSGTVDVCINAADICSTFAIRTIVEDRLATG